MSYCPNCNARLTCSCQRRTAKDGSPACDQCVNAKNIAVTSKPAGSPSTPNSPSNVKAKYTGPGTQI